MSIGTILRVFMQAVAAWWNGNRLRLGASVAYYTLFSIAPILIVATAVAGTIFGPEAVRGEIVTEIDGLIGTEGGKAVQALLQGAYQRQESLVAGLVGGVTFLLAACGAFLELQTALNTIWRVEPEPGHAVKEFLLDRLRSFGLVVATGFLLMVSLAATAFLTAVTDWLSRWTPEVPLVLYSLNLIISLSGTVILFGLLLKFLPDVELKWGDVFTGALVTALLFTVGKQAMGSYLGHSATSSAYGAVGSVMVLLLWVYYASQILLIGAEFTRLYADRTRGTVPASPFARTRTRRAS